MSAIDAMAAPATEKVGGEFTGLNSPPETNIKDTSDSDLSDIEDPEQEKPAPEVIDIHPEYYADDGRVPVFKPTMEDFVDFQRYMRGVNPYGMRSGIVKVIPPPEWAAAQPRLDDAVKTIRIKEPIKQDIMGTGGTYRQANILHQRSYNLPQWRQLCDQSDHQPPAKRGERRANQDKPVPRAPPKPKSASASTAASKKKGAARAKSKSKASAVASREGTATPDRLPTPVSPSMKAEEDNVVVKEEEFDDDETKPKGGRQPKSISVSSRRKYNRREAAAKVDEAAFKDFKYELEGVDYSAERCEELERAYWKTLTYAPPLYGADMVGSLFDDKTTSWNLGKLDNLLDVLGTKIPGVNTAYLYLGMWKATFAWHLEDVDLYSINYLHFGAPKQWYSISQGDARRFEAAMKTIWPTDAKACDQFLRHKTFLISPSHLLQNFNIKVNKVVHNPGEFVITFPYGYHSGYNLGYNCAEAVNFALDSWLPYGRVAKKCDCSQAQDSVWIDVHAIERKLRGEETEYEETDDEEEEDDEDETAGINPLTPPLSNGDTKVKPRPKKRKRPTSDLKDTPNVKRIRVRIKAPSKEPCVLCPNDIPSETLLVTDDGRKAHRLCALYIPETSIESGDKETVMDLKYIDKARLELKCNYCRSKKGACFQCSQKKCTRAYHATCAAAAGVLVEQGEIPVFGEDGTEYKDWGIEFSCRFHRSKRDKKLDGDALGDSDRIKKAGIEMKAGEVCQMQYYKGDIFAGAVVENRKSEEMLLVDILPRGERVEVEYKWLLIPDPADYHLPKPSANAIPMPKSRKDKESLNTSKRQADDIPRADDPFVDGCTWAEFNHEKIARNAAQVKIDFKKENQVWFYLGKTSTEARAQFTEDIAKPRHNPKGHFLDTIPKPAPAPPRQSYAASYPSNVHQHAMNAARGQSRPPLPTGSAKTEKPYVYKPRNDTYRVDQQAYHSQQKFLQQSANPPASSSTPYSFGTDPRWRSAVPQTQTPYVYHSTTNNTSPASLGPGAMVPPQHPEPQPQSQYRRSFPPTPTPAPAPASTPTPTPTVQAPQKANNPFSGRSHHPRPNPFAKYAYLQKEHNRSPLEYKSPYRPGGGFMNGYQGNTMEHFRQMLFQPRPGSSSSSSAVPQPQGNASRTVFSPSPSSKSPLYNAGPQSAYGSYGTPQENQPQSPHSSSPALLTGPQLHPAIRPGYGSVVNQQHTPPSQQRSSPSQFQKPVMKPPAMYDRRASQLQAPYQLGHPHHVAVSQYSIPTESKQQVPRYDNHSPSSGVPQRQQNLLTPRAFHQSAVPQGTLVQRQDPEHRLQQPSSFTAGAQPPHQAEPQNQHNFQGQPRYQESKSIHPHQQHYPITHSQAQTQRQEHAAQSQTETTLLPQVLQNKTESGQHRDLPDVPADSTSLIERMMLNLRKAA